MPTKKKPSKKKASTKKSPEIRVCPACSSHHLVETPKGFVCRRCGEVSKTPQKQSIADARKLLSARKKHVVQQHKAIHERHTKKVLPFLERFHLRMWFKIISTIILAGGIVLLFSEESLAGAMFTLIGIIGLWHAITSL